jgi:hypothetical protein
MLDHLDIPLSIPITDNCLTIYFSSTDILIEDTLVAEKENFDITQRR